MSEVVRYVLAAIPLVILAVAVIQEVLRHADKPTPPSRRD